MLSSDSPVVGPRTATALRAFIAEPEPPLAERGQVDVMIGKLALATAQPRLSVDEAAERLTLYWIALADIPLPDLRDAFDLLVKTATFLPTPAEIRTAALKAGAPRKHGKSRAKHLVWKHEQEWRPSEDIVPPEELRALLAGLKPGSEANTNTIQAPEDAA